MNYLAVVVAGVVGFFWGGFWYSRTLFGATWSALAGKPMPEPGEKPKHAARTFAIGISLSIVASYLLARIMGPDPTVKDGLVWGASVGAGFVATSFGINYAFGDRGLKLWLIDAGYHAIQLTLIGLVLALWP